jgi:uncharacterized membrane protein
MDKIQRHFLNCFIAGIVAILPIFGFVMFVGLIETKITDSGLLEGIGIYFPGLGIVACLIIVYLFGLFVTTFIGKWVWNKTDRFIDKLPVLGQIYSTVKNLLGYDTTQETVFKKAVLLPSSSRTGEEIGLVTDSITDSLGKTKLVVFIPFAPTPTSGRLIYIDESETKDLDIKASDVLANLIAMGKTEKVKNKIAKLKL